MTNYEYEKLSKTHTQPNDESLESRLQRLVSRTQSELVSIPRSSMNPHNSETNRAWHTGSFRADRKASFVQMSDLCATPRNVLQQSVIVTDKESEEFKTESFVTFHSTGSNYRIHNYDSENEHLMKSGQLGMCSDPYCTNCPAHFKTSQLGNQKSFVTYDPKFHNSLYGDAKGFMRRFSSFCSSYVPGVMNPHSKFIQLWNKIMAIVCMLAIFVDPLFFFLLYVNQDNQCIVINWTMTIVLVVFRSLNDFAYFLNILVQFRLAYISPESRVVGAGDLVDHPKKIALHYLKGYFLIDLFIVIPLPQIIILVVLPNSLGGANYTKNLLRAAILVQYIPRLLRFLPLLFGQSPTGFIFESAWANFIINLLIFMLFGHVVGCCWYLFGLQRVNQCLRDACHNSNIPGCLKLIDCGSGQGNSDHGLPSAQWKNNTDANNCLNPPPIGGFNYGIYVPALPLVVEINILNKYVYSLFWGFQQISVFAGNQVPSYFVWEVLFTMAIIGLGLILFALLIGNFQNFLQALGRRRLEMQLRGRDVEQWMSHRRLPGDLRRRVRQGERYNWSATRGVNEEDLMQDLPEDLQRDIRRHLFSFVKKVRIFWVMDEAILDAICERLRQKTYIKGSRIVREGGLVESMIFVVRGKLESIGEDGTTVVLSEGDACGEELLTWYLEHSSVSTDGRKVRLPGQRLLSNRRVRCLTNVEAFSLKSEDLEEVTLLFTRFLRSPRVQGALRYESPYWRTLAAIRIQVAWRYKKKCLTRANSSLSS